MKKGFHSEREQKTTEKLRMLCAELPPFCAEFFLGIQTRTTPLTRMNYAYDLRIFFDYLIHNRFIGLNKRAITLAHLEELTQTDLELFLEYLSSYTFLDKHQSCNLSAKERKLCTLRSFFKYFFNKDKLQKNIAAKVAIPRVREKEIVRLEPDEVARLLANSESGSGLSARQHAFAKITQGRDTALLTLLLGTGIRVSECAGLDTSDIDFSSGGFVVTRKGGSRVILYFSNEIASELKRYLIARAQLQSYIAGENPKLLEQLQKEPALFISSHDGSRLSVRAIQNLVKKYASTVTTLKNISPHKLRSTYGTSLYRETQDIYIVADVLGHRDVNTTKKHYAAISDEMRRAASSAVKLKSDAEEKEN